METMAFHPAVKWSRDPTHEKQWREKQEKGFILDGIAVSSLMQSSRLYGAIPPYNAQSDPHTQSYFRNTLVQALLKKTGQGHGGSSANGWAVDYANIWGTGQKNLYQRNQSGAGHCRTLFTGHGSFLSNVHPMTGYNGRFGYRRNTPSLRNRSSCFGEVSPFSLH